MQTVKLYISGRDSVSIRCPECGKTRVVPISTFKDTSRPARVKCSCGSPFVVSFEKRANYRKTVQTPGYYRFESDGFRKEQEMLVSDLSMSGIGFKPFGDHGLKLGDRVRVRFVLVYKKTVPVQCDAIVKRMADGFVGAQFIDLEENAKKEIGFYLLP